MIFVTHRIKYQQFIRQQTFINEYKRLSTEYFLVASPILHRLLDLGRNN
jgi:hypothetical protein